MASNLCSVAIILGKSDCHSTWLVRKPGEKSIDTLNEDDLDILIRRTGLLKANLTTICYHHEYFYIRTNKYAFGRKISWCCNPFNSHSEDRKGLQCFYSISS